MDIVMSLDQYKRARAAMTQEWTTTPPTELGWYWGFLSDRRLKIRIVLIYWIGGGYSIHKPGFLYDWEPDLKRFTHWLGPLSIPEPPQ